MIITRRFCNWNTSAAGQHCGRFNDSSHQAGSCSAHEAQCATHERSVWSHRVKYRTPEARNDTSPNCARATQATHSLCAFSRFPSINKDGLL